MNMNNYDALENYVEQIVENQTEDFIKETGIHLMSNHYLESDSEFIFGIVFCIDGSNDEFELMKCYEDTYDNHGQFIFNFWQYDVNDKTIRFKRDIHKEHIESFTERDAKQWIADAFNMLLKSTNYRFIDGKFMKN